MSPPASANAIPATIAGIRFLRVNSARIGRYAYVKVSSIITTATGERPRNIFGSAPTKSSAPRTSTDSTVTPRERAAARVSLHSDVAAGLLGFQITAKRDMEGTAP